MNDNQTTLITFALVSEAGSLTPHNSVCRLKITEVMDRRGKALLSVSASSTFFFSRSRTFPFFSSFCPLHTSLETVSNCSQFLIFHGGVNRGVRKSILYSNDAKSLPFQDGKIFIYVFTFFHSDFHPVFEQWLGAGSKLR